MSQHTMTLANQGGAAFRADLNNALAALVGNSSGATAPVTTYPYQFWADTASGLLKQRNAANSAWISVGPLADLGIQSGAQITAAATGTADAITATYTPAVPALTNGLTLCVRLTAANATTTPTFSPNGLTAKIIVKGAGRALVAGDMDGAGHWAELQYDATLDKWVLLNPANGVITSSSSGLFYKVDSASVAFTKTGAGTLQIKANTVVDVFGIAIKFTAATSVVMPSMAAGTDYAIYACQDGTVRADSSFTNPTGYTTANSRLIGGFHYGLVAPGTTVAGGSFNTLGTVDTGGMVWTQGQVDDIAGINKYSLWDLKWRANVSDLRAQKGFVLTDAGNWVAIYYASTNCDTNGLSKYNTDVASGTVLPKIPATMGGNGTLTYADYNWWRASEHARAYGARLLTDAEANIAFFGVTENQSLGGAASTIPLTTRQAGYTSKYGVEQATGHHWTWGDDSGGVASAYVANGGRGQSYTSGIVKVLLGGVRDNAANSGSRTSGWGNGPTYSGWNIGLRAACDHLMLA